MLKYADLDFTFDKKPEELIVFLELSFDDYKKPSSQRIVIKVSSNDAESLKRICIELSGKGVGISDGKQLRDDRNLLHRINKTKGDDFLKQNEVIAQHKHEEFFQCTAYVLSSTADGPIFILFSHIPFLNRFHAVLGEVVNGMGTIEKLWLSTPSTLMIDITKFGEVPEEEEKNYVARSVKESALWRNMCEKKNPLVYLDLSFDNKKPSKRIVIKLSGNDSESFKRICIELSGKGVGISDGKQLRDDRNLLHRIYKNMLGDDFSEQNEVSNVRQKQEQCSFQRTAYVVSSTAADGPIFMLFTHMHFRSRCHAVLGEVLNGMGTIEKLWLPSTMMVDITDFGEIPEEEEKNYVAQSVKCMSDDKENLIMAKPSNSVLELYVNKRLHGSNDSGSMYIFRPLKVFTPVPKPPPPRFCGEGSPTNIVKRFYACKRKYNSSCEFSSSWRLISYEESCKGPLGKKKKKKISPKKKTKPPPKKIQVPGVPVRRRCKRGVVRWVIPSGGGTEYLKEWKKYYSSSSESEPECESSRVGKKKISALLTGEGEEVWRHPWVVSDKKKYGSYKLTYSDSEVYSIRKAYKSHNQPPYFLSIIQPSGFYLSE